MVCVGVDGVLWWEFEKGLIGGLVRGRSDGDVCWGGEFWRFFNKSWFVCFRLILRKRKIYGNGV